MSNTITIEFSKEDRERLDGIGILLGNLIDSMSNTTPKLVITKLKEGDPGYHPNGYDEIQQRLAETLANAKAATEAPKNAAGEAEAEPPATTQPNEEEPTAEAPTPSAEPVAPTVTLEQIQQKVVQLAAGFGGSKKAAVREIINAYAKRVSDLPEDKWAEVWDKLTALESEG